MLSNTDKQTVIVADGSFPQHKIPLDYLRNAERIICCDGSVKNVLSAGYEPFAIVGDMDSLTDEIARDYSDCLYPDNDQETNDLTKTVKWCSERGYKDLVILGATGKREDHTIGNISLLADYASVADVRMITDTGILLPYLISSRINTFQGQQISIFSFDPRSEISSSGLKYPLKNKKISRWWEATLNESTGDVFELSFTGGPVIVFFKFREE